MFLSLILSCFSATGLTYSAFDLEYEPFVVITFGIGLLYPIVYATVLTCKRIISSSLTEKIKNCLVRIPLHTYRNGVCRRGDVDNIVLESSEAETRGYSTTLLQLTTRVASYTCQDKLA